MGDAQVMGSLLQDLGDVLCLAAVPCEALLRFEPAALSGFGLVFGVSCAWGHGVFLDMACESLAVAVCPRARSVSMISPLRHVLLGLPAFFCQRSAVYIRPNGLSDSHTIFCTSHRHREG